MNDKIVKVVDCQEWIIPWIVGSANAVDGCGSQKLGHVVIAIQVDCGVAIAIEYYTYQSNGMLEWEKQWLL